MAAFLFVCISVISSRYQRSQHKSPAFRGQGPFCSPDLSTLCAGCSKNTRQGYMPRGWRWRCMAGTVLRADGSQLEPYWPSLLLEVAAFIISRVPKQLTSGRFFQSNCCLCVKTDSQFFLICHLPELSLNNSYNNNKVSFFLGEGKSSLVPNITQVCVCVYIYIHLEL